MVLKPKSKNSTWKFENGEQWKGRSTKWSIEL